MQLTHGLWWAGTSDKRWQSPLPEPLKSPCHVYTGKLLLAWPIDACFVLPVLIPGKRLGLQCHLSAGKEGPQWEQDQCQA